MVLSTPTSSHSSSQNEVSSKSPFLSCFVCSPSTGPPYERRREVWFSLTTIPCHPHLSSLSKKTRFSSCLSAQILGAAGKIVYSRPMARPRKFLESLIKPFGFSLHSKDDQNEEDLETIAAKEQKVFPYRALAAATNNFNDKNRLGEGGFGPVYKGRLADGREVAVKKLSMGSSQGDREFMNEAMLLSRVQHRNVVNLYGYCASTVNGEYGPHHEKLLVYEYVPYESLDKILFKKREELDWKKRFDIIVGVARGLLYLHEDSHTTIIHRDIKASNILLDNKWVPKIADFGMARLYPEDQTHVNTRIAGTNGYMAPEYVMHGQLSKKADVFSFGVVVLELVSGQKNSTFIPLPDAQSLLEWAWRLYKRRQSLNMLDPTLKSEASPEQVEMCVNIGLLCTQADPKLRPEMRRIVVMLSKKCSSLPEPTRPGFPGSRYRRSYGTGGSGFSGESSSHTASSSTSASTSTSISASHSSTMPRSTPSRRPRLSPEISQV